MQKKYSYNNLLVKLTMFLFVLLLFIQSSKANEDNIKMIDSLIIPDGIAFFDHKNEKHHFDEYDGKTILVIFWATWCSSCAKEIPELDALQKDFRKLPFKILALSQDYKGPEIIEQFYKDHEIRYLDIFHDQRNALFKVFNVVGLPSAFLIDINGKVIASFSGIINWYDEKIRNFILKYIPGQPIAPKNSYQQNLIEQPTKKTSLTPIKTQDQQTENQNDQIKK